MIITDWEGIEHTHHRLYTADAREVLWKDPDLLDRPAHLVVTSPPYWNIKDYGFNGQIGYKQSYQEYLGELTRIWRGCWNVLHNGCKMVVNVGDQFLRASENEGRYEVVPIHADIIQDCRINGFIFLGNIIWNKITTTKTSGGGTWMGSIYHPRDGYVTYEHEYILIFKKPGKAPKATEQQRLRSKLTKEQRSKWFRGLWNDIPPVRQIGHVAMFPLELPTRLIQMFSFAGETILDPFAGSGTTMEAALDTGRNSIGIEMDNECLPMVKRRMEKSYVEKKALGK